MNMRSLALLIFLASLSIFLPLSPVHAEEARNHPLTKGIFESEFIGGIGTGKIPEGNYQPVLMILHLGVELKKYFPRLEKHRGSLSCFLETQFNPVTNPDANLEVGFSPGIQYRYPVTEKLAAYLLLSAGPHYISIVTSRQNNGFLFSDTIGGGFYYSLSGNSSITLGWRWRHLSNAGLKMPNGGINTNFITLGYAVFF
jgi:hypothetical protein